MAAGKGDGIREITGCSTVAAGSSLVGVGVAPQPDIRRAANRYAGRSRRQRYFPVEIVIGVRM